MSKRIQLPTFLSQLVEDSPYNYIVHEAIRHFSEWYKDSTLPFFPDYTNHGVDHLEEVMTTAEALITEGAKAHFSDADAVALVLAVLLHDSALHLSKAGFWELIKGSYQANHIPAFDKQDWQQTWDDFFFFARRWDDAKLIDVFGSDQEGGPKAQVRDPFDHWDNLGEADKFLIGEFIRQQHPRLAHEMAVYGIPGNAGPAFKLNATLPEEWRNMVGLIARSHGLALRPCVDYLGKEFGHVAKREYQNIHAVYLMALLRIADYVQIQSSRTSTLVFKYKSISSRVSVLEHKVHQAVRNITDKGDDPESIHIDAYPAEVAVFLRLKEWLAGIQSELDGSWAVLGEVYGLQPDLRNLGLLFRRVRSNLDDVADFATKVSYVPDRIRFDVARAELLKLLIGPLYGDDPSYGVRELMQNSIDAVREYEQFVLDHPEYADVPRREQEADVVIELSALDETGHAVMTISDRGIGMKEEVIRDYFLRAGASYRQSSQWKSMFETNEAEGVKSKILRSGRFGVGALAAFLIGNKVKIETRHINNSQGYVFYATLEAEALEINITKQLYPGTTITINVLEEEYKKLIENKEWKAKPRNWDWFCFEKPIVKRIFTNNKGKIVSPKNNYSIDLERQNWRSLKTDMPYKVYWTYDNAPKLTCNGIFITNTSFIDVIPSEFYNYRSSQKWLSGKRAKFGIINYPNIAIIDHDGNFPINLHRNGIQGEYYPFSKLLAEDILHETVAHLFYNGPTGPTSMSYASDEAIYSGLHISLSHTGIITCNSGFGLRIATLLSNLPIQHLIVCNSKLIIFDLISDSLVLFGSYRHYHKDVSYELSPTHSIRVLKTIYSPNSTISSNGTITIKHIHEKPIKVFAKKLKNGILNIHTEETHLKSKVSITEINTNKLDTLFKNHHYDNDQDHAYDHPLLEELFCTANHYIITDPAWLIDEIWNKFFSNNWIPFGLETRIKKFPIAAKFFYENYPQVISAENRNNIESLLYKK